ncbi:MAG TPA: right-handed parallel beta-helix repeat-containing protein, partial [Planctomycetota bacterium]|nr:right-handed parallel beta-helix repeat-containing protein [Planctomycetota bacterium]
MNVFCAATSLVCGLLGDESFAETLRVPLDYPSIQAALDAAAPGDTVLVAPGEYSVTEPLTFRGKDLTLRSEGGPEATRILFVEPPFDPLRRSVIVFDGGETGAAALQGFTLSGGKGSQWGGGAQESGGGGILSRNGSSPTVSDCIISGNAARNGGGVLCDVDSSLTLEGCLIERNSATGIGGGVLWHSPAGEPILRDCRIRQNVASSGGGLFCLAGASPIVEGCLIEGNVAHSVAGGLCCLIDSSPRVTACRFLGNLASGGGAISCETSTDSPVFTNCVIAGNLAVSAGALQARDGAMPSLLHCTVTANAGEDVGGGLFCRGGAPRVVNSIVWGNTPESICGEILGSVTAEDPLFLRAPAVDFELFELIQVGEELLQMPLFVVDEGDCHVMAGSAALDAATNAGVPGTDLEGVARPCGNAADIGAYESCGSAPETPFRRSDVDGDLRLNLTDAILTLEFLFLGRETLPCRSAADSNDSGSIDLSDAIFTLGFLYLGSELPPPPFDQCGIDPTPDALDC